MSGEVQIQSARFFNAHPKGAAQKDSLFPLEPKITVLLFAQNSAFAAAVTRKLVSRMHSKLNLEISKTIPDYEEKLKSRRYDIILIEYIKALEDAAVLCAAAICPDTPVIAIGGMVGEERIAALLRQGAVDYVLKDRMGRLPYVVMHALRNAQILFEKNQAKEALARSLKHLEEAQRVARMGSFEYDYSKNCITWSNEVFRLLGLDPIKKEISAEAVLATMDACNREKIIADWHKALDGLTTLDGTYGFTYPAGCKRWFYVRAQVSRDEQTQQVKMIGTVQDITEIKAAEQIAQRRAQFEHTILTLSREWINATPEQFDDVIGNTMRIIAEHCQSNWVAVYRFNDNGKTASRLYEWHTPETLSAPEILPLPHIEAALCDCEGTIVNIGLDMPEQSIFPCGAFALRTEGWLWGMLACGMTCASGEHPESSLVNLFCEMMIAVMRRRERELVLQETCENNRLILDSISDGFCTFDRKGTILDICKGLAERFGKTVGECIGIRMLSLFPEERYGDLGKKRMEILERAFNTGKVAKFVDMRDGRWYHNRFYPVNKNGKVAAVSLFSTDITDKQKADEEYRTIVMLEKEAQLLREKEQEYLELLDGSTVGSWIYDVQSGIMRYSSQWQKRLGIEEECAAPLESYYDNVLHPDDKAQAIEGSLNILKSGSKKYIQEYRLKTVDSGYIWVLAQGKVIYENGTPVKIYGTTIDISDRKRTEEALRESQRLLSMIIEGTSDHIFLKDTESRMVMTNSAVAQYFNLESRDMIGKNEIDFFYNKQQARNVIDNDRRVIESGQEETIEETSGDRVFLSKKAPWRDTNGNVIGLFGISRDITDRINMMQELARTAQELKHKNQLITDFFINISHEFKTPLSIMIISTELIEQTLSEDTPDVQSIRSNITYVRQNMFRLCRLVNNLLDITKIDAGFMRPRLVNRDVSGMLRYLVSSLHSYALRKDVAISFTGPGKELIMPADMVMIDRILLNLVSNALKHTPKGGLIEVGCEALTDGVRITVRDNGEGIPKDKQVIIFDRFRQANTALARSSEGCGIGLALVKSLVQILGGHIWVKSEPGYGSEFFVELPALPETERISIEADGLVLDQRIEMELSDIVFK